MTSKTPWSYARAPQSKVFDAEGYAVADDVADDEDGAMMAAAPEMLAALESVRRDVEIMSRTYGVELRPACRARLDAVDAAIAKARAKAKRS